MKKTKLLSLILLFSLLLSLLSPAEVLAQETEETDTPQGKVLYITSVDRFLRFAEKCRLDSYSRDLTVILQADLDLTNQDFHGIPIFLGNFQGNHHKISGLQITGDGSDLGLFRTLSQGSRVESLRVYGNVSPEGSRLNVGGIAGTNHGTILNCRFEGTITGADRIGGIAGRNTLTGVIEDCQTAGSFTADHFLGGIAGENSGVIRHCAASASLNTSPRENAVNVKSISLETIAGTETTSTVTDIGGIAGSSVGVIRDCVNRGQVGYPHIGYNVGGIAGSHQGCIDLCRNYGKIWGRKEVGGIAGQFEPVSKIEYQIDTLQILDKQLSQTTGLLNRAAYNAQSSMGLVGEGVEQMWEDAENARDALSQLTPGEIPDKDSLIAAHNALSKSIQDMHHTMGGISEAAGTAAGQLGQDLRAISSQMNAMSQTIRDANEHMGVRLTDISDQDTEADYTGKISRCENYGAINGDINAGGIAGSVAHENDMDPEDDLLVSGDRSLNFEGSLRAVILSCSNTGSITSKRLHAGGIVGFMTLGLVKDCVNTGRIEGEKAQYVGGIAGNSHGYIRNCYVKCELSGSSFVGGIAGCGTILSDCTAMVDISSATEKLGGILGVREAPQDEEVTDPIQRNLYTPLSQDMGAIDGVSFDGQAQPIDYSQLKKQRKLPDIFLHATLIFENQEGSRLQRLVIPTGSRLSPDQIPEVPEKYGHNGKWKELSSILEEDIYFDRTLVPEYTPYRRTIASLETRETGRPILLAEGFFSNLKDFTIKPVSIDMLEDLEIREAWTLPVFSETDAAELHFLQPEGTDIQYLTVFVADKEGRWVRREASVNGSHLIFTAQPGDQAFAVGERPNYRKTVQVFGIIGIVLLLMIGFSLKKKIKRKKKQPKPTENP